MKLPEFVTRPARSLNAALTARRCYTGAVVAAFALATVGPTVNAAETASTGANDEVRCSSVGFRTAASTWDQLAKCYTKTAFPVALAGTTAAYTGSAAGTPTGSLIAQYSASVSFGGCSLSGAARTVWYGPQYHPDFGQIPAFAMVIRTNCASGTYWNNVNSTQSSNLVNPRSYFTPATIAWAISNTADTVDSNRIGSGILWYGIHTSTAYTTNRDLAYAIGWPPHWYVGGSEWTAVSPFCGAEVTGEISFDNGTTYVSAMSTNYAIDDLDKVRFTTEYTAGATRSVEIRFPGTTQWLTIYRIGSIGSPAISVQTYRKPTSMASVRTSVWDIDMRCVHELTSQTVTLKFGASMLDIGDGRLRPCLLPRFFWPRQGAVDVGDVLAFDLQYTGLPTTSLATTSFALAYTTVDETDRPPASDYASLTWTDVSTSITLGTYATYNATAGYDGSVRQFIWRCTDDAGVLYATGPFAPGVGLIGPDPAGEEDCFDVNVTASFSSLATALGSIGSCILRSLFVPDDSSFNDLSDAWDEMLAHPPGVILADAATLFFGFWGDASSAAGAAENDDLTILPASETNGITMPSGSITPSDLGGSFVWWRALSLVFFSAAWLYGLGQTVKRVMFKAA